MRSIRTGRVHFVEPRSNEADTFSGSFMLIEEGARLQQVGTAYFDLTVRDESKTWCTPPGTPRSTGSSSPRRRLARTSFVSPTSSPPVVLFYNAAVGHHWSHDAATHTHLSDLERALQSLKRVTREVKVEVRYQKRGGDPASHLRDNQRAGIWLLHAGEPRAGGHRAVPGQLRQAHVLAEDQGQRNHDRRVMIWRASLEPSSGAATIRS